MSLSDNAGAETFIPGSDMPLDRQPKLRRCIAVAKSKAIHGGARMGRHRFGRNEILRQHPTEAV